MFKNFRNNYYFGKAGQGDLTPEDMPTTRSQLFSVTLRTRLPQLIRLNVVYALIWIPTLIVLWLIGSVLLNVLGKYFGAAESAEAAAAVNPANFWPEIYGAVDFGLLLLFPCIAITGPFTAGVSYVCRNWSRDEHAFVWSDFKDAVKENWKQALGVSVITGLVPVAVFIGVRTYHNFAMTNWIFIIPEAIVALFGVLWALSVTYMYPLMVSYELSFKNLLRNAFMPTLTLLSVNVSYLVGGTLVREQVFAVRGVGRLLFEAISNRDFPLVQAIALYCAVFVVLISFLAELIARRADPRDRA